MRSSGWALVGALLVLVGPSCQAPKNEVRAAPADFATTVDTAMEGVTRWFAPWPDAELFPERMLDKASENSSKILKATVRTFALGAFSDAEPGSVLVPWK